MICFSWKERKVKESIIFYYNNEKIDNADIYTFTESMICTKKKQESKFITLFTDLTLSEEELMEKIDKGCKYEIRRAENKDELTIKYYTAENMTDEISKQFVDFYNSFTKNKGLDGACDENLLNRAKQDGKLTLSFAYQNDVLLVAHAYLVGDKECRLWYSCSSYRNSDNQFRSLVGRANRNLHWKDICHFKGRGLSIYDWGGISDREEIKNITAFKKEFGGEEKTLYNYRVANTFKGKVYLFLLKILRK